MLLPRAITLGLNLGSTNTVTQPALTNEPAAIVTNVVFDDHKPIGPLAIATPLPKIEKVSSRAEEEAAKAAAARLRSVRQTSQPATITARESEPDFATKRSLVQQIAAQAGIDWKLLESVWQIESGKAWHTPVTSSAGALGPMQFMPGTWLGYGGGGDVTYAPDALRGAAKLLAANGAASGDVYRALFSYNHADWYVRQVQSIMNSI